MKTLALFKQCSKFPMGNALFSKLVCFKAPYFNSIKPRVSKLDHNICQVDVVKRRKVVNHLNTVHAIAMCNMAELAAGLMTDASIPHSMRWIPKGMEVNYFKKAKTNLKAIAKGDGLDWQTEGDVVVPVEVIDDQQKLVFTADITMNLKAKV